MPPGKSKSRPQAENLRKKLSTPAAPVHIMPLQIFTNILQRIYTIYRLISRIKQSSISIIIELQPHITVLHKNKNEKRQQKAPTISLFFLCVHILDSFLSNLQSEKIICSSFPSKDSAAIPIWYSAHSGKSAHAKSHRISQKLHAFHFRKLFFQIPSISASCPHPDTGALRCPQKNPANIVKIISVTNICPTFYPSPAIFPTLPGQPEIPDSDPATPA